MTDILIKEYPKLKPCIKCGKIPTIRETLYLRGPAKCACITISCNSPTCFASQYRWPLTHANPIESSIFGWNLENSEVLE